MKAINEIVPVEKIIDRKIAVSGEIKNDMLCELINRHAANGALCCSKPDFDVKKVFEVGNSIILHDFYVKGLYAMPEYKEDLLIIIYAVIDSYFFPNSNDLKRELISKWNEISDNFDFADLNISVTADYLEESDEEEYEEEDDCEDESFSGFEEYNPYSRYSPLGRWVCQLSEGKMINLWFDDTDKIIYSNEHITDKKSLEKKPVKDYITVTYKTRKIQIPVTKKDSGIFLNGKTQKSVSTIKYLISDDYENFSLFLPDTVLNQEYHFNDITVKFTNIEHYIDISIEKCFDRIEYALQKNEACSIISFKLFYYSYLGYCDGFSDFYEQNHKKYMNEAAAVSELISFFEYLEWYELNVCNICETAIKKAARKKNGTLYIRRISTLLFEENTPDKIRYLFSTKNTGDYEIEIPLWNSCFGSLWI